MCSSRKAQANASSAAILVALIGLLLIGYVLTIPPADREALLNTGETGGYGSNGRLPAYTGNTAGPLVVMIETPGTLELQASPVVEHAIPSTTVFTATNTVAVKELSSLYLKNSLFSRQAASFRFNTSNLQSERFLLTFNVEEAQGDLIITLNGNLIYHQTVTERSPQPILLPQDYIREENELVFSTSGVGYRFWSRNEYQLRNVLISTDAVDFRGAVSEQHFAMPEQEYNQLEYAQLSLIPECDPRHAGRLVMEINGRLIYSGYPDCGILNKIDLSKEFVRAGDNRVVFVSEEGSYLLDRIQVISYLQEQNHPVYYFNLPLDIYEPLDIGDAQLILTMRFADYRAEKRGEIIINGFVESFQAGEYVFQAALDPNIIVPGPNTIQIIPHVNKLDIAELRIEMI